MPGRIEDYAIIGDTGTVALVDRAGSIDWWCAPRFDSPACFAALLGDPSNGHWRLAPTSPPTSVARRYRGNTLVLETEYTTDTGVVAVMDFMAPRDRHPTIFRVVECRSGSVTMAMELVVRFDYGSIVPWAQSTGDGMTYVAGPEGLRLHSPVPLVNSELDTRAEFTVVAGERLGFSAAWYESMKRAPRPADAWGAQIATQRWWEEWASQCTYAGDWQPQVMRSLITLKALTHAPTGGIVAAATTSLPEEIGGVRNWDYRYCWLRDATFTLRSLLSGGYREAAADWVTWLRRAVAGAPGDFQIMYGIGGERRLTEMELDWLPGYEHSAPVRIGNEASEQFQLDVFGEVMDSFYTAYEAGLGSSDDTLSTMVEAIIGHLARVWDEPDDGIWEVRGPRRQFTHSKVMAWVAFDRAAKMAEQQGRDDVVARVAPLRDAVHAEVCEKGFNTEIGAFTQYYGGAALDASLLMMAPTGFLPASDPRIVSTVEAIQKNLSVDGFIRRYQTDGDSNVDGLPGSEGAFLMTTFWLADNLNLMGRRDEALEIFERLLALTNDVGLLSEEYDPSAGRMLGNFPQAFSHVALINSAVNLSSTSAKGERIRGSNS